jgi:hypothetical protein
VEPSEAPVIPGIETTRYTAEEWKSRAMYEESRKLTAERALARARDLLNEALFAAAHLSDGAVQAEAPVLEVVPDPADAAVE